MSNCLSPVNQPLESILRIRNPRWWQPLLALVLPTVFAVPSHAQTIGGGTLSSPAVGPAPAYDYGYGSSISSAVLVKNWDFGTDTTSTIHNVAELSANFQYHDQFGRIVNNGNYGAKIVSPDSANKISGQPVENVDTTGPVREFFTSSIKTYLLPLDGATTLDPNLQNTGNGSFQAKWTPPNGGSLLGLDVIWETRVRYVTPPYFWFALWASGNKWGNPKGAEVDVMESFGYDNGGSYTNYDGRFWHSDVVGGQEETPAVSMSWAVAMARYGITSFDATQWHTWTWVYKADNTFTNYVDGIPVQRGETYWTYGALPPDSSHTPINMSFIFDGSWGYKAIDSVNHPLPASQMVGKYYEWDYSRVYYRQPTASDTRNLATAGTISGYSSQASANPATSAIDGIYNSDTNFWGTASAGYPAWIEVDLGANKQVNGTELIDVGSKSYKFRVEAKADGGTYQTVVDQTAGTSTSPIQSSTFTPLTARYVKLTVTGSANMTTAAAIREFKILGSPVVYGNVALNKPATASSSQTISFLPANAVDGNSATRWSSNYADNQWIYVDLGATSSVSRVKLNWETAYASGYKIQTSNDASVWSDIYSTSTGNGAADDVTGLTGSGRYVRVLCVTRATGFGISLWDFEVYP